MPRVKEKLIKLCKVQLVQVDSDAHQFSACIELTVGLCTEALTHIIDAVDHNIFLNAAFSALLFSHVLMRRNSFHMCIEIHTQIYIIKNIIIRNMNIERIHPS